MASRSEARKRVMSSLPGSVVSPIWTSKSGLERGPESRRLKERRTVPLGVGRDREARRSRSEARPRRSATTEGYQSTGLSFSSWKQRTG